MVRWAAMWILCCGLCGASAALGAGGPYEDQPIGRGKGVVVENGPAPSRSPQATPWQGWLAVSLTLAGVVGLILVLRPMLGRLSLGRSGGATRAIEVVGSQVIGPRQRVLLLRVGKRLILVGHTGAGMNALCEIHDPDEVASLLGQLAAQSSAASRPFSAAMKWARRRNDEVTQPTTQSLASGEDASLATTRQELGGLMDKVRQLSRQYQRS